MTIEERSLLQRIKIEPLTFDASRYRPGARRSRMRVPQFAAPFEQ
jgi:hypothetical protein